MAHTDHLKAWEVEVVEALVDEALKAGFLVSVWNGGDEAEIDRSNDRAAILEACGASDSDRLVFFKIVPGYRPGHRITSRVGAAILVYGNEPGVTVSDYTVSDEFEAFLAPINALHEEQSENMDRYEDA